MTYNSGSAVTNYTYNADGIRTSKTVGGTKTEFFLNGSTVLAQKIGSTVMPFYYDANGTRIAFKYNGTMYYYVYNLQGDVTHIMKSDGSIVGTYEYDAWGKITNLSSLTTIAGVNPFRYRGYYYDNESGLYYLNSRYYNPEWGRFINADGIIGETGNILSYNLYAYCFDNPVLLTDSDGYCPYNGTAADFHRMEQGLPSLDCDCEQNQVLGYSEHQKKGTTNPANREKHQQAETRRKRDNGGEKGDARRKPNPNKRRQKNFEFTYETVLSGAIIVGGTVVAIYLIANDVTGVGVFDDAALVPVVVAVWDNFQKITA